MVVTATEVPISQANGICEFGNTPATDFDCRFTSYFTYSTTNGNATVPLCDPYANGNCVFYSVYYCVPQGSSCVPTPGQEPPATFYQSPVSWLIKFNNTSFMPPPPYQTIPRLFDDPDYQVSPTTPYGTNCTTPMNINGVPTSPPIFCQFVFDITTAQDIGGKTQQFNDVVVAFPITTASPNLSITKTADATTVNAGSPIGFTISVANSSVPGTGTANNVTLNDPLPAGSGVNWSISPAYGGPGTCSITGSAPSQVLNCSLGNLSPAIGASVHASSSSSSVGTYPNTATVTADNSSPKTASASITVSSGSTLGISPTSVNFGNVYLGTIAARSVTITNKGTSSVKITNALIGAIKGGNSDDFFYLNLCPATLAAGKSCVIILSYIPDGDDASPQSAVLMVTDSAAGSPQTVPLSGTMINPQVTLSATSVSFGTQKVGTTSVAKTVTLTNTGSTTLNLSTLSISGNFASASGTTCVNGGTLTHSSSCTIKISFTPTATGSRTGSIKITDNALNSPQLVILSGTGH
jgi:uncharacterized repeat protein (TIGR01451 family)